MATIITYVIDSKHVAFKDSMKALGYQDQIPGIKNCNTIYFPNTTLHHANKTAEVATEDAKQMCKKLGIDLERCISTEWNNWVAICGEDFN